MFHKQEFNTQKINENLNEIIKKYGTNIDNDNNNENSKKYQSIQQYAYINDDKKIKNSKNLLDKKIFYTQDNKIKNNNTLDKNLLINSNNINNVNDSTFYNLYNNKYKSLSNILKNKKMISSPVLDLYTKNFEMFNYFYNNNNDIENNNENDIKTKNKNTIDSIENNTNENNIRNINNTEREYELNLEIEKLKNEIFSIQKSNNILLNKLNEEKMKYATLSSFESEDENIPNEKELNNLLADISNNLGVETFDEIVPKLKEMIDYLNINIYEKNEDNNKRNEFILKIQELYLSSNKTNEKKEHISIKILWRWIKSLINNYKSLMVEKTKKEEILKNLEKNENFYKECCDELMVKYKKNNLEELNKFIEELIKRNNINKKRVEQLKKILVNDIKNNNNNIINNMNNENNFKITMNCTQQNNEDITFNKNY